MLTLHKKNLTPFTTALAVSANREHLRLDRSALRAAGVPEIVTFASIEKALVWIVANPVDVVLLDADLGRTTGAKVLRLLRRRRSFATLPVIVTSMSSSRACVLEALGAGCSGYLVRPYSQEGLLKQCRLAASGANPGRERIAAMRQAQEETRRGRRVQAIAAMKRATSRQQEAHQYYTKGCDQLSAEHFELAIGSFNKALAINNLFAEAYIGMANAWEALGEPDKAKACMRRAVDAHARNNGITRTRNVLVQTLMDNPNAPNPFLDLGFALVRQGELKAAGQAYSLAVQHGPTGGGVYAAVARACLFTSDPRRAAKQIAVGMAEAGGISLPAETLYQRIMGDIPSLPGSGIVRTETVEADECSNVMNDILAVLKYTWKLYRNGGPLTPQPLPLDF
ncbi:response regulator [Desulfovibrio ferrophilus]|uniref:Response regulator receiver protein n=1 Tax=Desulfovibrio ferrophilus TaxID=241368 RepID=A0A2Z6AZF0_9BACT|nr:response regulator [Desulfovibrio ferrophilus]BBD08622.1 response regulator receiver protein [Desulfovibrio ferrophilus]